MKLTAPALVPICLLMASTAAWAADPPISSLLPPANQAAPAAAPAKPKITVNIDPALRQQEGEYKAALKQLEPGQQAALKDYEGKYLETVTPEVELLTTAKQEQFCEGKADTAIAKDKPKYQSELGVLRTHQQAFDKEQRAALRTQRVKDTPFIDAKLVDDHDEFMGHLTLGMAEGMAEVNASQGAFANTDCAQTAAKLDAGFDAAAAPKESRAEARKQDEEDADELARLKKAADKGDPEAMTQVAMMRISGTGMPKDPEGGIALLKRAAETGYERAEFTLGVGLATDVFGLKPDKEKAKYWLAKAAAQGDKKAADLLKNIDNLKPSESIASLRARADKGDAGAQYEIGMRYAQGWGVDKDQSQALQWLLKSAGQGNPQAESDVALLLIGADRVAEGVDWMTKAANKGVTNSQISLAGLYLDGKILPHDQDKAVYWYKKAAEAGDPRGKDALEQLGKP